MYAPRVPVRAIAFWEGASVEEPRAGRDRPELPRAVYPHLVLAVPTVGQGEGPSLGLPTKTKRARITAKQHIGVADEQPAILRQLCPALPQFRTGGALIAP